MAYRQIALLACTEDHLTPLMTVKEDFSAVVVSGLGDGDEVRFVPEDSNLSQRLQLGLSPFPVGHRRFQIQKVAGASPRPTSVEIIRGGK